MTSFAPLHAYIRPQRWRILGLALLSVVTAAGTALQPWPLKLLVDHVACPTPLPGPLAGLMEAVGAGGEPTAALSLIAAAVLLVFAVSAACEALMGWGMTLLGRHMTYHLGDDLFRRYQRRPLQYHLSTEVGETLARVADDSWITYRVFDELLFKPLQALFFISIILVLMVQLDWQLALIVAILSPAMVAASMVVGRRMRAAAETGRQIEGRIRAHVQQTLAGIAVVQAFGQERREEDRLRSFAKLAIDTHQRSTVLKGLSGLGSGLIGAVGTALILWFAAHRVLAGELSLGGMLVFVAYLRTSQTQVSILARMYPTAQTLSAMARRVTDALCTRPYIDDGPAAHALASVRGRVEIEHVTFAYDGFPAALRNVSLAVQPGQTVALVGPTGAGKSTLAGLIPRFFDPQRGRVLIDGHDVRNVRLASLRAQVAVVLQEPFLFPVSIAENIAFGRADASSAEIERAARAANAHDFISRLPEGYDTHLGERGSTLSGGERQRIAIARALLKDAPILILDEPTSALDSATEALILEALENLLRGRTTFIIAHRLSTVKRADLIAVLQDGRIVETGSHEELLGRSGLYASLSALQSGREFEAVRA